MMINPAVKDWLAGGEDTGLGIFHFFDCLLHAAKQPGVVEPLFVKGSGDEGSFAVLGNQPADNGRVGVNDIAQPLDLLAGYEGRSGHMTG